VTKPEKKPTKAKKITKAKVTTYTFEEIKAIMDEEIANDTTPKSRIDWRTLPDEDPDDE
jgi:hypothetical protein